MWSWLTTLEYKLTCNVIATSWIMYIHTWIWFVKENCFLLGLTSCQRYMGERLYRCRRRLYQNRKILTKVTSNGHTSFCELFLSMWQHPKTTTKNQWQYKCRYYCQDILKYKSSVEEIHEEVIDLTIHVQFVHAKACCAVTAVPLVLTFSLVKVLLNQQIISSQFLGS